MGRWLLLAGLLALVWGPQWWARRVLRRYAEHPTPLRQNGSETARTLLDQAGLSSVKVEETSAGDHYDPVAKVVRLSHAHANENSLAAVVVAAHEVGHAIQDATGYRPLTWRTRLVRAANVAERLGSLCMLLAPAIGLISRSPAAALLPALSGLCVLASGVIVHLVTLPVELDASFRRALPVLSQCRVISPWQLPEARQILRACAFTYLASSLSSMLNIWRWFRVFRT